MYFTYNTISIISYILLKTKSPILTSILSIFNIFLLATYITSLHYKLPYYISITKIYLNYLIVYENKTKNTSITLFYNLISYTFRYHSSKDNTTNRYPKNASF